MKERPILFSAPMIRAILAGTKTQTRRIVKPQPFAAKLGELVYPKNPYGQPGDQMWVRETWRCFGGREYEYQQEKSSIIYRCDVNPSDDVAEWRPSIFMFRWASRINLLIKSIRVERLNDISEEDAKAEGVEGTANGEYVLSFGALWESINGIESWEQNPWVWVVEFEVMK